MPLVIADRVRQETYTTGTGSLTLEGALNGYTTLNNVMANGNQFPYAVSGDTEWEVGIGTLTSELVLARTTVLSSSNAGALVDFSAGVKNVVLTLPAALIESMLQKDRNLLDNGAMNVCQRVASVAGITTSAMWTVDRWGTGVATLGTWTQSQTADGPAGTGITKCFKMVATTGDASPAAGDYCLVSQNMEGQFLQYLLKGTAAAKSLTLSFWVKGVQTGNYVVELYDYDNTRSVSAAYTINVADTWEYKTVTFPGDTTGAFTNDANLSLSVGFWLAAGSSYTGGASLQTAWGTPTANKRAFGQTNLAVVGGPGQYWQITGVQLEVGKVPTTFEIKRYDDDLWKCYRYFYKSGGATSTYFGTGQCFGTTGGMINFVLPRLMRAAIGAFTTTGVAGDFSVWTSGGGGTACTALPSLAAGGGHLSLLLDLRWTVASGMAAGNACNMYASNANGFLSVTADL